MLVDELRQILINVQMVQLQTLLLLAHRARKLLCAAVAFVRRSPALVQLRHGCRRCRCARRRITLGLEYSQAVHRDAAPAEGVRTREADWRLKQMPTDGAAVRFPGLGFCCYNLAHLHLLHRVDTKH